MPEVQAIRATERLEASHLRRTFARQPCQFTLNHWRWASAMATFLHLNRRSPWID